MHWRSFSHQFTPHRPAHDVVDRVGKGQRVQRGGWQLTHAVAALVPLKTVDQKLHRPRCIPAGIQVIAQHVEKESTPSVSHSNPHIPHQLHAQSS